MLGYCCINETLKAKGISVNRGMQKAKFEEKGIEYAMELAFLNLQDLQTILEWNVENEIFLYRMSSDMFSWSSAYSIRDAIAKYKPIIFNQLKLIGQYAKDNNIRLTFHPGPYNVLASENEKVIEKTIHELHNHSEIMDLMDLSRTPYNCINIHLGTTKPSKEEVINKFIRNFQKLSIGVQQRLTIENDDSEKEFSVQDLYLVSSQCNIPIVFDQHHYYYGPKDQSLQDAFHLAISTWGDIKPLTHHSSSRQIEDPLSRKTAHADYIYSKIEYYNTHIDTEIEAKAKELALLNYRETYE